MAFVRDILAEKGSTVYSLPPGAMVFDALKLMAERDIGSVLLVEDSHLAGIFTERLYARDVFLKGRASPKTPLADVMSSDVVTVDPGASCENCLAVMNERGVRHLPVLEDGRLVGIVSVGDLLNRIIADREFDIGQLVEYVGR